MLTPHDAAGILKAREFIAKDDIARASGSGTTAALRASTEAKAMTDEQLEAKLLDAWERAVIATLKSVP